MKNRQDARRKRGGFTLVEIIVVLALIGILIAFSAGGILGYTTYATYKRNNESARTIFSAAQSAITYYKSSGKLDQLRERVEALSQNPAFVPQEAFDNADAEAGGTGRADILNQISYLKMSRDESTYNQIKSAVQEGYTSKDDLLDNKLSGLDPETKLLFEILSDYVTDVSLYDASVCVEFDATDGVVSGVFFSDRNQAFSYGEAEDAVDITQRDESYLKKHGVGYYSTALSDREPTEEVKNLKIAAAEMVNAESLDVQWFLGKKYQYLIKSPSYTIDLYEDGSSQKVAEIVLENDSVAAITRESGVTPYVCAEVTLFDSTGVARKLEGPEEGGKVKFHAYLTDDEEHGSGFALSLDVLDDCAGEALTASTPEERQAKLLSTYSAYRLSYDEGTTHYGLHTDGTAKLSASVSVTGNDNSERKTGEMANTFFADPEDSETPPADNTYEIANARHLYNAGLHEQQYSESSTYEIIRSFAWGGPDGLLSVAGSEEAPASPEDGSGTPEESMTSGNPTTAKFYHNQNPYRYGDATEGERTQYPAFPGIERLNSGSTLSFAEAESGEGDDGEKEDEEGEEGSATPPQTIDYLTLEPQINEDGTIGSEGKVGLVRENNGTIEEIKLAHVDVRGVATKTDAAGNTQVVAGTNVGAFCGVNNGTLTDVETVSGYVTGGMNVGGIVGSLGSAATVTGLKNGAEVSGILNVGGIVGTLTSGSLSDMTNTGIVYGWNGADVEMSGIVMPESKVSIPMDSEGKLMPMYIGGIAGSVSDATIENSVSNPAPQADAEGNAVLTADAAQARLYGTYVGGIAGYLAGDASVKDCAAGAGTEEGSTSYILGENFVGGIVGMNAGTGSIEAGETNNSNGAAVIGRRFVGGIVGANGTLSLSAGVDVRTASHTDIVSGAALSGWRNEGFVMATGTDAAYVGGIAGVNAGTITDCASTVADSELFEALGGNQADFVGGVVGCNRGSLETASGETPLVVSGTVGGRDFVGGIAGYNDGTDSAPAVINGYTTENINVNGRNFTGGVVGLNTAEALIKTMPEWTVGEVTGANFVGGYAGANIIAPTAAVTVALNGSAANVTATGAFAGGLFGYNRIVSTAQLGSLFDAPAGTGTETDGSAVTGDISLMQNASDLQGLALTIFGFDRAANDSDTSGMSMTITGGSQTEAGEEGPTAVTASIFAGGVLGYNAAQTSLTISNYASTASVTATDGLMASDLEGGEYEVLALERKYGEGRRYSFSGGILGYVTENTKLENCSSAGIVSAENATYLGGLAEINEGAITGCTVNAIDTQSTRNYVGGIVGINGYTESDPGVKKTDARIESSTVTSVNGHDVVGGLAAENHGTIANVSFTGTVSASGSEAGGIAAINHGTISAVSNEGSVTAAGSAGGIAGRNAGMITGSTSQAAVGAQTENTTLVPMPGGEPAYIGGIAGENLPQGVIYLNDITDRQPKINPAAASVAGGIAGRNLGEIASGKFKTDAEGAISSDAEPVTVTINIEDSADRPATLGGIAGQNEGTIREINYKGEVKGHGSSATTATACAYGGIAGVNTGDGSIEECTLVAGTEVAADGRNSCVGGFAGRNSGSAEITGTSLVGSGEAPASDVNVKVTSEGAWATGGVVGINEEKAKIVDAVSGVAWIVQAKKKAADEGVGGVETPAGPVGGIIGLHASSEGLNGLENRAGVESDGEAAGGIVGRVAAVSDEQQPSKVVIQACRNLGTVRANSKAGGIVGEWALNAGGNISGCDNGAPVETTKPDTTDQGDASATVSAAASAGAAGIVGSFSSVGGQVELLSCTNFGVINNELGAGVALVGGTQQSAGGTVVLTDCANAGRVTSGAGIAVCCNAQAGGIVLKLNRCRNYGRGDNDESFAGLVANVAVDAGGAAAFDSNAPQAGRVTIANSIGVADVKYPTVPLPEGGNFEDISKSYGSSNVYYYSMTEDGSDAKPQEIGTAGAGAAVCALDGAYRQHGADEPLSDRPYLKAVNTQAVAEGGTEGDAFDPNGESYERDYRGNHRRLDLTLAEACLNLQEGKKVNVKTPLDVAGDVNVENNGGILDITWENQKNSSDDPDIEVEEGIVYKTVVELRFYDSREDASADAENNAPVSGRVELYGGIKQCSMSVSREWMIGKWVTVTVTNYAYDGTPSNPMTSAPQQILRALATPNLVVQRMENAEGYGLALLNNNQEGYAGCLLRFTVMSQLLEPPKTEEPAAQDETAADTAEDTPEVIQADGEAAAEELTPTARSKEYTVTVPVEELPALVLSNEGLSEYLNSTTEGVPLLAGTSDGKVRLSFTDVQMQPLPVNAGGTSTTSVAAAADGGEAVPVPVRVENTERGQTYAASKKIDFNAILPSTSNLESGFLGGDQELQRDSDTVSGTPKVGVQAAYRAELLDNKKLLGYELKDVVVAATESTPDQNSGLLQVNLKIPSEYSRARAHARVYPQAMSGEDTENGARFAYCVAKDLGLEALLGSGYVTMQPTGGETQGTLPSPGETTPTEPGDVDTEESTESALTQVGVNKGYSVVCEADGTFSVYFSHFLKMEANVLDWTEPEAALAQTASYGAAGAGAGIQAPEETTSDELVADETESEEQTESEEEETESETQDQSESDDDDQDESDESEQPPVPVPKQPELTPDWDDTFGLKENGEPKDPISEEAFLTDGVKLTIPQTGNTNVYMYVAFYSEPYAENDPKKAPKPNTLIPDALSDYQGEWPIPISDSYIFTNLPLSCAGKYMCVQLVAYSSDYEDSSELSEYFWFRLPRVALKEPKVTRGADYGSEYTQVEYITDETGEETEKTTVTLNRETLVWEQTMAPGTAGYGDVGYKIDLYGLLDSGMLSATVNLLRNTAEGGKYALELAPEYLTADERAEYQANNKPVPSSKVISIQESEDDSEVQSDSELLHLYEAELSGDDLRLDDEDEIYSARFEKLNTEDDPIYEIEEDIYPIIQIREYGQKLLNGTEYIQKIEYRLILPDVVSATVTGESGSGSFLGGCTAAYCTHSVVITPLLESTYVSKDETLNRETQANGRSYRDIEANSRQYVRLYDKVNHSEMPWENMITNYPRVLKPYMIPDEPINAIDWEHEVKKENIKPEAKTSWENFAIFPRTKGIQYIGGTEAVGAAVAYDYNALDAQMDYALNFEVGPDGEWVEVETDAASDEVISDEPLSEDSGMLPTIEGDGLVLEGAGDAVIIDDDPQTQPSETIIPEPQTQAAEPQTQTPAEPQTQTPAEPQTQLPVVEPQSAAAEVVTEAVEAFTDQAEGVMAEGFPEIPADPGTIDGEGF